MSPSAYLLLLVLLAAYLFPTLLALWRDHPRWVTLFLCNLFLGWTAVTWIVCVIWAAWPMAWGEADAPWLVRQIHVVLFPPRRERYRGLPGPGSPRACARYEGRRGPVPPPRIARARRVPTAP